MNRPRLLHGAPLLAVLLAGCSGVPLSTLWHYRGFGPEDFLATNPATLRAAIGLEDGVSLAAKPPEVTVRVRFGDRPPRSFAMPLTVLKQGAWVGAGAGKAVPGRHWYLLALSPAGIDAYRNLQGALARHVGPSGRFDEHGSLRVNVATGRLDFDAAARRRVQAAGKMYFQTRLELSPKDGFYTLYAGTLRIAPSVLQDRPARAPASGPVGAASAGRGPCGRRPGIRVPGGAYSGRVSPDPPNSAGKSFSFGRPSFIGRTVS